MVKKKRKLKTVWITTKKYGKIAVRKVYDVSSAPATKRYAKSALRTAYSIKGGLNRWERKMNQETRRTPRSERELKKRLKNIRRLAY